MRMLVLLVGLCAILAVTLPFHGARAELAVPAWWDPDGVSVGQDWHYRVPVTLPVASSVNSTARVDVDFAALLAQLGVSGTFDPNSVRVVRPNGTLATIQEFTDTVYSGATDATGNARGEVRWIVQDGGAQTYHIYFDITQNGAKPANAQTPINGNFERGGTGQISPTGWTGTRTNNAYDAQVRPNETVSVTDTSGSNQTSSTNGNANSGGFSYLMGSRTNAEPTNDNAESRTVLTRTITVPATNPGSLTVRWRPEGWDSSANGSTNYDYLRIEIIGTTTTEIVGPTAGNYPTRPFAPNLGTAAVTNGQPGYGQYNGWDMGLTGGHTAGMTAARNSEPWWTHTVSLAPFAGQTVTIRFRTRHTYQYKTWFLIDDVEWSVVNATLGTPQGFGARVLAPVAASTLSPGQVMTISARFDARPTAAGTPVTANVYDNGGALVASGIILYDDGTHGDATAGDGIWTNNGSVGAQPTYTIPFGALVSSGWTVRVFGRDGSTSTGGAANNGLIRRVGQPAPAIEANYWNIAETSFNVVGANITVEKTSSVVSDPLNGTVNPKAIPGAVMRFCLLVSNAGPATATSILVSDPLPANLTFVPGSIRSGTTCANATTVEDDNATGGDEDDPFGASWSGGVLSAITASLANGASMAIVFNATVN